MKNWKQTTSLVLGCVVLLGGSAAHAQHYPDKQIRIIVPFPTGSSADVFARTMGSSLQKTLGQPVIVDNRPGANGIIGIQALAKSAPDGYTIGLGSNGTHGINVSLFERLPYDPVVDFAPITNAYGLPYLVLAPATATFGTLRDLTKAPSGDAGKLTVGAFATGAQLTGQLLRLTTGLPLTPVLYKTQASAVSDLIGGHLDLMIDTVTGGHSTLKTGRAKALAITSRKRSALLPNVPTVEESGYPGFESTAWVGLFAPAGTPAPIIDRLNSEFVRLLQSPEVREQLLASGIEPIGSTPSELQETVKAEVQTWARVFKEAGLPTGKY